MALKEMLHAPWHRTVILTSFLKCSQKTKKTLKKFLNFQKMCVFSFFQIKDLINSLKTLKYMILKKVKIIQNKTLNKDFFKLLKKYFPKAHREKINSWKI